jgi:hypothetical protein
MLSPSFYKFNSPVKEKKSEKEMKKRGRRGGFAVPFAKKPQKIF